VQDYRHPESFRVWDLIRWFPIWHLSQIAILEKRLCQYPLLTYPAIDFLHNVLNENMRIYEYGSGQSTLFFSKQVKEVITVEHDPEWSSIVQGLLQQYQCSNCQVQLIEPSYDLANIDKDVANPDHYATAWKGMKGYSFYDYATSIEKYPDKHFDLIVVDGRARPSCFSDRDKLSSLA
jgi:hypothetical protein